MIDREKVIKGLECCADGNCKGQECPYHHNLPEDWNKFDCNTELARDALELLKPRLLKWTEVDQFDVVYIEVHEDEEGLGEWSGYGFYEHQGTEPGTLQFAVIGKSMRLVTDPNNYNIYWRCWSSKPDRDQMESTPWKDPY